MARNELPIVARVTDDGIGDDGGLPADAMASPLDYVRELRAEKRGWQLKAKEMEAAATQARDELRAARDAAAARIVEAEFRTLAVRAGMIDPDGVKLLDLSGIQLNATGGIVGAESVLEAARLVRPWLFAGARTSNPEAPPRPRDVHDVADARQMTPSEYAMARQKRAWRR